MADRNTLDFAQQAEQMMAILENRLQSGQKDMVKNLLILKFKTLYELGVASGRLYEAEGVFPYGDK
ncbi:MAG: hypothetical protein V4490_01345 [Pseudomonadota bacterium]